MRLTEKITPRCGGRQYPSERPTSSVAPFHPCSARISTPCKLLEIRPSTKNAVPLIVMESELPAILTIHATTSVSSRKEAPSSIEPIFPTAHRQPFTLSMISRFSASAQDSCMVATNSPKCPESLSSLQPSTVRVSSL